MERIIKIPGPAHPIHIRAAGARVVVSAGGQVLADSVAALVLQESTYPPVYYFPRTDVNMALLGRSDHASYCPYKGDCSYYDLPGEAGKGTNGAWSYEDAYPAVAEISGYLAFYPERVDAVVVGDLV